MENSIKNHLQKMADLESQLKTLVEQMKEKILSLPENERCTRISEHIVVVSYASLVDVHGNLDTRVHDFKKQYQAIVNKIDLCVSFELKIKVIENCIKNGFVEIPKGKLWGTKNQYSYDKVKLHPQVIQHLKNEIQL